MRHSDHQKFWLQKSLVDMTDDEWESLCDGCGRCCLTKRWNEDKTLMQYTDTACRFLELDSCRCSVYPTRTTTNPNCRKIDREGISKLTFLPPSCAYRLVAEGRDLSWWHHLVSGDKETVHTAGVSVRERVRSWTEGCSPQPVCWPTEVPGTQRR
jgi:uncharacterized protein